MRQFLQRNLVACKLETRLQCYNSSSVWDPVGNNQLIGQIESVQGKDAQWITNNWNYDIKQTAKELQFQSLLE